MLLLNLLDFSCVCSSDFGLDYGARLHSRPVQRLHTADRVLLEDLQERRTEELEGVLRNKDLLGSVGVYIVNFSEDLIMIHY